MYTVKDKFSYYIYLMQTYSFKQKCISPDRIQSIIELKLLSTTARYSTAEVIEGLWRERNWPSFETEEYSKYTYSWMLIWMHVGV